MPTSKTRKKNARKQPKRYRMVTFAHELFEDDFTLPDISQMPGSVVVAINRGQLDVMYDWLRECGVDPDSVDAISTLDPEETQAFQKDWSDGNLADLPKSSD
ncbi:hypothetical protein [Arthrobacter sp. NPDC090010]|uniref:hypothetical protein n=1 Tax=Arthrobacter sp. NPDC090010 TaxID=3363942 RepID=UPI003807714E